MKKLFTIIALMLSISAFAQDTLNYRDMAVAKRKNYKSYTSKDGIRYKIGDKITIGFPTNGKTFSHIKEGDGIFLPFTQLGSSAANNTVTITGMYTAGIKSSGFNLIIKTTGGPIAPYIIEIENAIETKEVKTNLISSDEALAELKKCKDKLDLGLITQEEFDKKKAELTPFIK